MNPRILLYLGVAVAALAAGLVVSGAMRGEPGANTSPVAPGNDAVDSLVGKPHPGFTLGAADGRRVSADEFAGEVLLVNFWATWCAPCREEMPMLVELQAEHATRGLRVVGIALDDVQQARDFAAELGVNYTILVGGADVMAAGAAWGNRSGTLPYTVLVDRDGIVRWTFLGPLQHDELFEQVEPLL